MFEDIDDPKPDQKPDAKRAVEVTSDANDRLLVYAIWTRNSGGGMPVERGWSILHERYPDDARFQLLHTFEELIATRTGAWSPSDFLTRVRSVLDTAGGRLNPEVRDLLAVADDDLHPLSEEDAARLDRIRARVSMSSRSGDPVASRKRLSRLASDVVRELHDRTAGGKAVGRTSGSMPAAAAGGEWKTALAAAKGARTTYAATAKVAAGDVVEHPKFGPGVVMSVEPGRAQILFESGARKLVAG